MPAQTLLRATQLACERGDRLLFSDLSFQVGAGELLQVTGPNGSGKTSLLRILCGLLLPDRGTVYWTGDPIGDQQDEYLRQVHYSGHLYGIKLELTPRENLRFARALHGGGAGLDIDTVLERVELYGFEDEPAATLSAGQRRRIGLAGLLVSCGRLWVLDEPFTTLDVSGSAILEQLIEEHLSNGGCVVMASHSSHNLNPARLRTLVLSA